LDYSDDENGAEHDQLVDRLHADHDETALQDHRECRSPNRADDADASSSSYVPPMTAAEGSERGL